VVVQEDVGGAPASARPPWSGKSWIIPDPNDQESLAAAKASWEQQFPMMMGSPRSVRGTPENTVGVFPMPEPAAPLPPIDGRMPIPNEPGSVADLIDKWLASGIRDVPSFRRER
jgi:hypothetical protein